MGGYGIGRCMDEYAKVHPPVCWCLHPFFAFCWWWGACGGKSELLDMHVPLVSSDKNVVEW